jgi:hypothetical protein
MKTCNQCNTEKPYSDFHKKTSSKDGFTTICKNCRKVYTNNFYIQNSETIKLKRKEELQLFPERVKNRRKKTYQKNRDKRIEEVKIHYKNNKESIIETKKKYIAKRRKIDIEFKLQMIVRSRLSKFISGKTNEFMEKILGCNFSNFKIYIEEKFVDGMSWENHSIHGWHIDHIIPLSSAKNKEDLYKLCHYTNLQPLWAKDNLLKSNKI